MIDSTGTFDMRVFALISARVANVSLKFRAIFPQVVPVTGRLGPIRGAKCLRKTSSDIADTSKVIVERVFHPATVRHGLHVGDESNFCAVIAHRSSGFPSR